MDLKQDISSLKQKLQAHIESSYEGKLSFPDDNIEECNIKTRFKICDVGEGIYISGKLHMELSLLCSRCIEHFNYRITIPLEEICLYLHEDPDDNYFIEEDLLDFQEVFRQKINLHIPIKPLCDNECKGLCSTCGTNLNINTCECDKVEPDFIWTKLKENFNKSKGG